MLTLDNKCDVKNARETCAGNVILSKSKMGKHFDDVLVHDVCWSSQCD